MSIAERLDERLAAAAGAVFAAVGGGFIQFFDVAVSLLPQFYSFFGPLAFSIAPRVPFLPAGVLQKVTLALTAAFVVLTGFRLAVTIQDVIE